MEDIIVPWDVGNTKFWEEDDVTPNKILDLRYWFLTEPIDTIDDNKNRPDEYKEAALVGGHESAYFYVGSDDGVVFSVPASGSTTENSNYPRSELREMLRWGLKNVGTYPSTTYPSNENNWILSSSLPLENEENTPGGVNGKLEATLAVNRVAQFGSSDEDKVGSVIIGQIHSGVIYEPSSAGQVPLLLIYRQEGTGKGTIYIVAEDADKQIDDFKTYDFFLDSPNEDDQADGIALGKKFSYVIEAEDNQVTVTLIRENKPNLSHIIDYTDRGYDSSDQYLYFKAGAYALNTYDGEEPSDEYSQVTFYSLGNSHDSYPYTSDTEVLNLENLPISNYDDQHKTGGADFFDGGTGVTLDGNTWQKFAIDPFTITEDTTLSFEFKIDSQMNLGEIHGIGFDDDNILKNGNPGYKFYQLAGTQKIGQQSFNSYSDFGNWVEYEIPLGYLAGTTANNLVLIADQDKPAQATNSSFRNLIIDDGTLPDIEPSITEISFSDSELSNYDDQHKKGGVEILDSGNELKLFGNTWQKLAIDPVTVSQDTLLRLEVKSNNLGEINALGLDSDNDHNNGNPRYKFFQFGGTQILGNQNYHNYAELGEWQEIEISLGSYLNGETANYITFIADQDIYGENTDLYIRNLEIVEF